MISFMNSTAIYTGAYFAVSLQKGTILTPYCAAPEFSTTDNLSALIHCHGSTNSSREINCKITLFLKLAFVCTVRSRESFQLLIQYIRFNNKLMVGNK